MNCYCLLVHVTLRPDHSADWHNILFALYIHPPAKSQTTSAGKLIVARSRLNIIDIVIRDGGVFYISAPHGGIAAHSSASARGTYPEDIRALCSSVRGSLHSLHVSIALLSRLNTSPFSYPTGRLRWRGQVRWLLEGVLPPTTRPSELEEIAERYVPIKCAIARGKDERNI